MEHYIHFSEIFHGISSVTYKMSNFYIKIGFTFLQTIKRELFSSNNRKGKKQKKKK